jgi:hypothetical protein
VLLVAALSGVNIQTTYLRKPDLSEDKKRSVLGAIDDKSYRAGPLAMGFPIFEFGSMEKALISYRLNQHWSN